ncbi:dioxygenase [Paracoccus pacificus]|uniref:Dioxygenase n=1 Tax=Paracoccus pacificus TaxID=1463598 RepID=A0ABW4R3T6_9RHOB
MRNMTKTEMTDVVLDRYSGIPDPRMNEILQSLIKHAHAFVREVRLTEAEWMKGIEFLTATGQISDDKRQEMILLSDNLGISSLVNMVSAGVPEEATETTVLCPFYVPNTPKREWGESILPRESDEVPLVIHGNVGDQDGNPIPNASEEIEQPFDRRVPLSKQVARLHFWDGAASAPT